MELTMALEQRFYCTPDGRYWTGSLYPRSFWSRYLAVFDGVKILARVHEASAAPDSWKRVDGDGVSLAAIPAYVGPWDFVRNIRHVRAAVARALVDDSALLLRVPGVIATSACSAMRRGRPYGVEVLGDPWDVFSPGTLSYPFRSFFRWWFARSLRIQCREAACGLYVTEQTLQRRYPLGPQPPRVPTQYRESLSVGVSDVELTDEAFVSDDALLQRALPPVNAGRSSRFRIAFVGTLEVPYKNLDVLIAAFARCVQAGLDAELVIIGSGRQAPVFESVAKRLRVSDRLTFMGTVPAGEPIRQQLDASDLFVLPSRQEGMPRALIEAMARGLACIGTRVGGMLELLPDHAMVMPGDPDGLAAKILELAANPTRRAELGAHNLATARRYHQDLLQPRRMAFYRCLRDLTAAWRRDKSEQSARRSLERMGHRNP
jgi:glycosyltransferase involved in cell wall biosynthesis